MIECSAANEQGTVEVRLAPRGCSRRQGVPPADLSPLLLTVEQVSQLLGISVRSVWRLVSAGDLPRPIALGRAKRWERAAIEAYVSNKVRAA